MSDEPKKEFDDFLSKVDDIHRLVQCLSSKDETEVATAMKESDKLLKNVEKTGFDRTSINKSDSKAQKEEISPNAFMSALEKDAEERAEQRRKNKIRADEIKVKGNEAFHQERFEEAIQHYTEALQWKKDYDILYTNRAQVYVKLKRYDDAIHDCDWALKVTPTMIKALVIKGKCLLAKKEFDAAEEQFSQCKEIIERNFEPIATRRMIEDCLAEVDRQREHDRRENSARTFLENEKSSSPLNLSNTLKKLEDEKQNILFYIGGVDLLRQLINDETTRAAFRVENGFELFDRNPVLRSASNEQLNESTFQFFLVLCQNDDENVRRSLETEFVKNFLASKRDEPSGFEFFVEISLNVKSRATFLRKISDEKLDEFLEFFGKKKKKIVDRILAGKLIGNLAIETRTKNFFDEKIRFEKLFEILRAKNVDPQISNVLFSLLTNLVAEKRFRNKISDRKNFIETFVDFLDRNEPENQFNLLGLMINLTAESNETLQSFYERIAQILMRKMKNSTNFQRIFTLLANLAVKLPSIVDFLLEENVISWTSQTLTQNEKSDDEELFRAAIRLIGCCTQSNVDGQRQVAQNDRLFLLIFDQLSKSRNSFLIGNASLVCGNVIGQTAAHKLLEKTIGIENVFRQVFKLVEELWLSQPAKKNLAIFITKLAKSNESFLDEFRRQHGTEILHSAMKNIEV